MTIRNYTRGDAAEVLRLWNTAGAQTMGYAPQSAEGLDALLLRHPDFSEKHSFVLTDADGVRGFVSGVTGDTLAQGRVRGYFSCLLLDPAADSDENTALLLAALEDSFRAAGKSVAAVTCFYNYPRLINRHRALPPYARARLGRGDDRTGHASRFERLPIS